MRFYFVYTVYSVYCLSRILSQCYDPSTFCNNKVIHVPDACATTLSMTLPDVFKNCSNNVDEMWKTGVPDGSSASTDNMIYYDFIFCSHDSFALCGYVPLDDKKSPNCGQVLDNLHFSAASGVIFGAGIDLGYQNSTTLKELGASDDTIDKLYIYLGLTGTAAAETVCDNPLDIDDGLSTNGIAYKLSVVLMDKYMNEVQSLYDEQRKNNTFTFTELPLGVRTVLTSIYWRLGKPSPYESYPIFWEHIISNNFKEAVKSLRFWFHPSRGNSNKQFRSEANVIEASLGCVSNIDTVFLLDGSGSVGADNFVISLEWVNEFIASFDEPSLNNLKLNVGSRFGVSTFSSATTDNIFLNQYSTLGEYSSNILSISYPSGSTRLGDALTTIGTTQWTEENGMRPSVLGISRLLIVLTDGKAQDDVVAGANSLKHLNLNIVAVGIANYDEAQLKQITDVENIYFIDTFSKLSLILYGIVSKSCYVPVQIGVGGIIKDIEISNSEKKFFSFKKSGNLDGNNIVLNINQTVGCVYVYISYCIRYPSYYVREVNQSFTSCSQPIKQIILSPDLKDCSAFESRRLLEADPSSLSSNIFVAIEGIGNENKTSVFDIFVNECNSSICQTGTNYDESVDTDQPYTFEDYIPTTSAPTLLPSTAPNTLPSATPTALLESDISSQWIYYISFYFSISMIIIIY